MPQNESSNLFAEVEEVEQKVDALGRKVDIAIDAIAAINKSVQTGLMILGDILTLETQILAIIKPPPATSLVLTLGKPVQQ